MVRSIKRFYVDHGTSDQQVEIRNNSDDDVSARVFLQRETDRRTFME
ncbi:hypothetical protein P9D34_18370 [Bacillus swezeyi]|nr:hypothetical protein [Bacillus swezeyi]MEC1262348.1 hypothetical protein [Bacillus swezeyi]MED2926943.1 hypothetical protein [Bacillus swezeyi]MED2943279.1 hypothetical protein [Bacillus swezeyi]MED2965495.1 hypothetical protein [Bacillus swezeyi]MED2978114.1 hypothetical protein [Bacillus swezeyi]